ncbi:MAG: SMI1/KNR4 family protein [Phycisphaerales bacterium]|nr:SMI1/KNR4 family protein [Phycisphaerales bacterium]
MAIQSVIDRIVAKLAAEPPSRPLIPATREQVAAVERALGFPMPPLLRACYLGIGNGGFGPGYGFIPIGDGISSLEAGGDMLFELAESRLCPVNGGAFPASVLPFCYFGCAVYSCVDCADPQYRISHFDAGLLSMPICSLDEYFERWLRGDHVHHDPTATILTSTHRNPFKPGQMMTVKGIRYREWGSEEV